MLSLRGPKGRGNPPVEWEYVTISNEKCRKNREIATPVCALARNDMFYFCAPLIVYTIIYRT